MHVLVRPSPGQLPCLCRVTWSRTGQMICKEPESKCFRFMGHRVYVQLLSSVVPAQKQPWTIVNERE